MWLSVYALGHTIPPEVRLFVVPLAAIGNLLPLPGGVGGVEAGIIGLLTITAGIPLAVATGATLVYRGGTFWLPILIGAGALVVLENDRR